MADYNYQTLSLSCTDKDFITIPCPDSGLLNFSGKFTLEMWIKVPVFQTEKTLILQKNNFSLKLVDKNLVFSTSQGTDVIAAGAELYEDTWHSIVVIVYEKDIRIVVDNNLCIESVLPNRAENSEPTKIGSVFFGNIPCEGDMPTPEEWLKYAIEKLEIDGQDDLLRWFINK